MEKSTGITTIEKPDKTKAVTIDADVHESFASLKDLVPYLEEPYKRLIAEGKWKGFATDFAYWTSSNQNSNLGKSSARSASSYEKMREDLLDKFNIRYAILTGYFYPSMMKTQYDFATALASAYNDFMIENWLEKDDRFLGSIQIAPQDPSAAAREIDRLGSHPRLIQVMLPIDFKAYGEKFYHPIFEAAQRHDLRIAFHHTTIAYSGLGIGQYSVERHMNIPQLSMAMLSSILSNGVFDRFPKLKFIFIEGGFTWVPSFIWRVDREYKSLRQEIPWVKKLPSKHIRERVRFSTQPTEDITAKEWMTIMEFMGNDEMLLFSTDYPHYDFDSPTRSLPNGLPKEIQNKILYENAIKFYRLD